MAGGGDNLLDVLGGAGNQVLLLGTGADTVRALAGDDTVDGNTGGKLIMLGSGANYVISHAGAQVDTVMGGSGSASVPGLSSQVTKARALRPNSPAQCVQRGQGYVGELPAARWLLRPALADCGT